MKTGKAARKLWRLEKATVKLLENWEPVLYSGGRTVRTAACGNLEYRNVPKEPEDLAK